LARWTGPAADSLSRERPPGSVTARYFHGKKEVSAGVRPTEKEWPATPDPVCRATADALIACED
jgi:hypothetical protein